MNISEVVLRMRKKKIEIINWNYVYRFSAGEFSEDPNKLAEPELIYSLGNLRKILGTKMRPSPVSGALARKYGSKTSQHYAVGRLSTGSDQFIEGVPFEIFSKIMYSQLFTGVGIYFDTKGPDGKPWVMFHLDIRERETPFIWFVHKLYDTKTKTISDCYRYPQYNPEYWRLFNDDKLYKNKLFGA